MVKIVKKCQIGQVMFPHHKSLGSLCSVVKTLIVSGAGQTRCPIELFWTAKNTTRRPLTQTHMYTDSRADLCQA